MTVRFNRSSEVRVPGKQPRKRPPRPRWRTRRINKRVLPNHRPAPHFLGDKFLEFLVVRASFRFSSSGLAPKPALATIRPSARRDSGLIFSATMAILSVSQIDPAC